MQLQFFKDNFYDAVYQHTRKLFWPSMAISVITAIVMLITLIPLFFNLFPEEVRTHMMNLPQSMEDMEQNSKVMEGFMQDHLKEFIILYVAVFVVGVILWAYGLRVGYTISKRQMEGEYSWSDVIFRSFDNKFVRLVLYTVIMIVMGLAAMILASSLARFGIILFFLAMVLVSVYLLRFAMAGSAIVIADMSVTEAMRYSAQSLGWGKSFKLLFFIFVALIAAGVIAMLISLLVGLILGAGLAGTIVSNFILLFVNASVYGLLIAGSAGLLYRYGSFEEPEETSGTEEGVSLTEPEI